MNLDLNSFDSFVLISAVAFFLWHLLIIVIFRVASSKETYTAINRVHKIVGVIYLLEMIVANVFYYKQGILPMVLTMAVGLFIYITLHYIFLFQIIAIGKKSISVNFLAIIAAKNNECHTSDLQKEFGDGKGFSFIKNDRLNQMTFLNFAKKVDGKLVILPKGRILNGISSVVLSVWGVKRSL